jgi:mono/diheme cytochrome c family protein
MNTQHVWSRPHRSLVASAMALALGIALLGGCSKTESNASAGKGTSTTAANPGAAAEAKEIFTGRCVACHGPDGKGDGPGAAALNPKPRNYSDKSWQASVTDEAIKKIIVGGGQSQGKSPLMPPNADLESKPEVVAELVKIIRAFGK